MTAMGIEEFACNHTSSCPYVNFCNGERCDPDCTLCEGKSGLELLSTNVNSYCRPYVVDRCFKHGPHLDYWRCENGVLRKYWHFKEGCTDAPTLSWPIGQCTNDTWDVSWLYFNVDCNPDFIEPG